MAENELLAAYKSIPIVTRTLLTATLLVSVLTQLKIVSYYSVMLSWHHILYKFEVRGRDRCSFCLAFAWLSRHP